MGGYGEGGVWQRGRRAARSTVLDHLQRASIPVERLDSSVERRSEKREGTEGEKEAKTWETRGKGEKREHWGVPSF